MTSSRMCPDQDPDDYLYHIDSCRHRFNACDPPEGPTDRQYEDIILQALPSECDGIRQTYLERRDYGLANIRRMMVVMYAENLSRSKISKGLAGRDATMQRWTETALVSYVITEPTWAFQNKVPIPNQTPAAAAAVASSASSATTAWLKHQQKPRGRRQNNVGGGAGRV